MCTPPNTHKYTLFILSVSLLARQNTFLLKINTAHIIWSKIVTHKCSWTTAHPPCGLHSRCVRHRVRTSWNNTNMKSVCGHSIYEQWNPLHLNPPPPPPPQKKTCDPARSHSTWPPTERNGTGRSPCSAMGQAAADERASYISQCLLPPALLRCLATLATRPCWMHLI